MALGPALEGFARRFLRPSRYSSGERGHLVNYEHMRKVFGAATRLPAPPLSAAQFARLRLEFQPDAKQQAVLESASKRGILLCSRQFGKSTISAIVAVN